MMQIAQGQSALLPMAGLQRKQGHVWQVFSSPCRDAMLASLWQATKETNGLENVPAIQMATAVPPNMNTQHYQTTGRHVPQSSLEFSFVLSFFQEKERTTTHCLRLHTITQTASIFFQTVFVSPGTGTISTNSGTIYKALCISTSGLLELGFQNAWFIQFEHSGTWGHVPVRKRCSMNVHRVLL